MENNERDRKLDQWLDEALSQYSAAEPRLGLEQRVLAHVRTEEQARSSRRAWWRWMPAFAAIAAVLIVAVAVRPYWEQKSSSGSRANGSAGTPDAKVSTEAYGPKDNVVSKKSDANETNLPAKATATEPSRRSQENVARDVVVGSAASQEAAPQAQAKKEAVVQPHLTLPAVATAPAPPETRTMDDKVRLAKAPERADDKVNSNQPMNARQVQNLYAAPAAAAPPATIAGGVLAEGSKDSSTKTAQSVGTESVEVQSAAETVQAHKGIIGTEKVKVMPDVSGAMKAMKVHAKPKSPLAKKLEENVDTVNVMGVAVRTELKRVPAGPAEQFPSPSPLSKEEELMLAAAKQMKNAPSSDTTKMQKPEGDNRPIEIKKIEIAPLPGPHK